MLAATYPGDPTSDFQGTIGSYTSQYVIFGDNTCARTAAIANVWLFGTWIDNGPADWASYRKIGVNYQSMKIKPLTVGAVTALASLCPCGNSGAWQLNTLRTITVCTDACEVPWVNFSNVGAPHYGVVQVSDTNVMKMSEFIPVASYSDNTTLFTLTREDTCPPLTSYTELCGDYVQECRPSATLPLNMRVSFSLLGNAVGTFTQAYDYYAANDTDCSHPFVASYHISGNYALHGSANCSGQCQNGVAIEVFAQSSAFMPLTNHSVKELNDKCPCGGKWSLGIARIITVCPFGTCVALDELEWTNGIPAGTMVAGFGILVPYSDTFMTYTKFTRVDDYKNEFTSNDFSLLGDFTDECAAGKMNNEVACGQYVTQCSGSFNRRSNYIENVTFFGPNVTGAYRRVYQQFDPTDRFCMQTPDVEYIMEGTFAIDGDGTCADCTAMGTYSKIEIAIARTQITVFNNESLQALKGQCPCGQLVWKLGTPISITTCPLGSCLLESFPGVQGIPVGTVAPAYGTITRFDQFITMTDLNVERAAGWNAPFTTSSHILYTSPHYDGCNVPAQNALVCGSYRDGCRGGTVLSDNDNLIRTLTLYGEQFGLFSMTQQLFLGFDTDCTDPNLNGQFNISGTYALHGPSTCGGSCKNVGAQLVEMSTSYAVGLFYNGQYIDFLNSKCPCNGTWAIAQSRTITECMPGTCALTIRGLPLGSGAPVFGSLVRFGDVAMLTTLNPSDTSGYNQPFDSLDQPYYFDNSSTGGACPASPVSNLCGVYRTACTAYASNTSFYNMAETFTFAGDSAGTFTKTFKSYSATQPGGACAGIVLQQWLIKGTYKITGASTCGGTCTDANSTMFTVTETTITLLDPNDVEKFNNLCACGGTWEVLKARTIADCDHCALYGQQGAHGLEIGTAYAAYGSLTLASGRLALTRFSANPVVGYSTAFEARTDRVFAFDANSSTGLYCPSSAPASPSSSSDGLTAGDGLLIAFFCILAVYLIGGMLLNYRSGLTGVELVPHLSFWKSIPGLVGDGFRFSFVECFGLRGSKAEYQPITGGSGYGATA